jgi:hypothetical protein
VALSSSTQGAWPAVGYMFACRSRVLSTGTGSQAPTPRTPTPPFSIVSSPPPPPPPQSRRTSARSGAGRRERDVIIICNVARTLVVAVAQRTQRQARVPFDSQLEISSSEIFIEGTFYSLSGEKKLLFDNMG